MRRLFLLMRGRHRNTDPDTSRAAGAAERESDIWLALIIHSQNPNGLTDYELQNISGLQQNSIGKRRTELYGMSLVCDSGSRRPGPTGAACIVWKINPNGIAQVAFGPNIFLNRLKEYRKMAKGTRRRKGEMVVEVFHKMGGEPVAAETIDETGGDVPVSDTPWNEKTEAWNSGDPQKPNISWLVLSPTHLSDAFPDEALDELPIEVLADLQEQMTQQQNLLDRAGERMADLIGRKYGQRLKVAQASSDTGTFRIAEGNYEIKMVITKRVEWDQDFLAALRKKITDAGDDAGQYIKTSFGVGEREYQSWSDKIKSAFLPGRTLKPSKPSYEIEIKL